jgi:hypothetical protein
VNGQTGSDTTGNGSEANPWQSPQKAANYLAATATWPSSGDVVVHLRPAGYVWKGPNTTMTWSLDFTNSARAPNPNRWLIWSADQGRVKIENPDGSDSAKIGTWVQNTAYNNYMIFDGIGWTGGYTPKGRPGYNDDIGLYLDGNNNHHIEVWNYELEGFRQTDGMTFESLAGILQEGTTGPLYLINGIAHDMATPGSTGGSGGPGLYLHGESGDLVLNFLSYNMYHGNAIQFYNSGGGAPGNRAIVSHATFVDIPGSRNTTMFLIDEDADNVKIVNSIFAFETGLCSPAIQIYPAGTATGDKGDHLVFYRNASGDHDTSSGWTWTNNLEQDPLFVDRVNRNYRLSSGSPAIGYTDTTYSPAFDLEGNIRPAGAEDAGAYERR